MFTEAYESVCSWYQRIKLNVSVGRVYPTTSVSVSARYVKPNWITSWIKILVEEGALVSTCSKFFGITDVQLIRDLDQKISEFLSDPRLTEFFNHIAVIIAADVEKELKDKDKNQILNDLVQKWNVAETYDVLGNLLIPIKALYDEKGIEGIKELMKEKQEQLHSLATQVQTVKEPKPATTDQIAQLAIKLGQSSTAAPA